MVILSFLSSFLTTAILTPWIRRLAIHTGFLDIPNDRKIHKTPTPFLGGLAIFCGIGVSFVLFSRHHHVAAIAIGACMTVLLGLWDDKRHLSALKKLIGQLCIAAATYFLGISISFITDPFTGDILYLGWLSFPMTVLWIVSMMNTLNLIDGLDGLATGVAAISAFMLTLVALALGQYPVALLGAALLGASLGFLRYNFSPAQIFLGDAGSLLLGYLLATLSIIGVLKSTLTLSMLMPILVLGVPIFDTVDAIFRRIRHKKPIYLADSDHVHHRLLRKGFSQKETVLILYALTFACGGLALTLGWINHVYALPLCTALILLCRFFVPKFPQLTNSFRQKIR